MSWYPEVIFTSHKEIKCVFLSVVVRTAALKKKYAGGLKAFVQKYNVRCNRNLAVIVAMNHLDLEDPIADLEKNGLIADVDYLYFDATRDVMWNGEGVDADVPVPWLKGVTCGDGMKVYYNG
jgi:hypothetical protein